MAILGRPHKPVPLDTELTVSDTRRLQRLREKAMAAHTAYLDAVTDYSAAVHVIDLRIRKAKVRARYRALRQVKALWGSS
jgi:hypothetical protein